MCQHEIDEMVFALLAELETRTQIMATGIYPMTLNRSLKRLMDSGRVMKVSDKRGPWPAIYKRSPDAAQQRSEEKL